MKILSLLSNTLAAALLCACGTTNMVSTAVKSTEEDTFNVGYGSATDSQMTSRSTRVKAEDLPEESYSNITEFLQGRLPGVQIISNGDSEPTIVIRGANTIMGSTNPLYILDGTEISSITQLDPKDIYSVEVLSDTAASIYGVRGGNGVLVFVSKGKHEIEQMLQQQKLQEKINRKASRKNK